jgi:ParB-like nuclease domain
MRIHEIILESYNIPKIKLSTDPEYFGADVDDRVGIGKTVVNIPLNNLVGFEPDEKMKDPDSRLNMNKIVDLIKSGHGDKLPPIFVRKYKGGYQVLDGHHRFHAYKKAGAKTIPAKIIPNNQIEIINKSPTNENFADGKGPGQPGDSRRHGIPKKASLATLDKIGKGSGRKAQLARWQANMRRGRKKKNRE